MLQSMVSYVNVNKLCLDLVCHCKKHIYDDFIYLPSYEYCYSYITHLLLLL